MWTKWSNLNHKGSYSVLCNSTQFQVKNDLFFTLNVDIMVANNRDPNWIHKHMCEQPNLSLKLNIKPSVCKMPLLLFLCMLIRKWQKWHALIDFWFPADLMKHELCFPFSLPPLFSASLREESQGATDEQWHIPLGSWKWYHTEPTFCRLCKMLITPLSAFKLICFIALERVRCMLYHTTRMQCALCYVKCFEAWLYFFQTALFLHFIKVRRACFQPEIVLYERLQHYHVVEEWHRGLRVSV